MELVFNYQVPKIGNGLQLIVPSLKEQGYILASIEFESVDKQIELTISHGGVHQKFGTSYFKIFDRINLQDHWYRLTDGERIDLNIKNKSNKQIDLQIKYIFKKSRGTLINSSSIRAGDLKESNLLNDLSNGYLLTDLYLKTDTLMRSLKLIPNFKVLDSDQNTWVEELESEINIEINDREVLLDFAGPDLISIRKLLAYYNMVIEFADNEQPVYVLAYGFKG